MFEPLTSGSPATEIKFLEGEYKKHSDAIAQLEAIEVQVDPVIKTFLLQQMTSFIANEPKNTMLLGIPMATVVRDGFQDHSGMVTIIEQAIMEYTNDPERNRRPGTRHPGGPGGKGRGTVASATQGKGEKLTKAEQAKLACVYHRERALTGHMCINNPCNRNHAATGNPCQHPATGKYGRCPDYFTKCLDNHPFSEDAKKAYGSPQRGWTALKDDMRAGKVVFAFTCEIDPANEITGPRSGRGTTRAQRGFE